MSSKPSALEPLRVRVRRFQFIVGLGFLSLVVGAMLSVSLVLRLHARVSALPSDFLRIPVAVALEDLWVLAVLPTLCYGAARIVALRTWTTAVGAALSGGVFVLALNFVRDGMESFTTGWTVASALRGLAFVGGILLSARAIRAGRAAAEKGSAEAEAKAVARKSEYDEFLKAAEAGGARLEQREGGAAEAPAASGNAPAATAPTGEASSAGEATTSSGDVPKTPAA
ncbi:hypothetical protein [Corallococcus exiguus]|uniref:Uncharacterized protein n=1 Tax=Corallococcus exiguus TaxID=83462 RepID=A0A7X4YCT7_9BACT|nr:hypothetical protein [Corallococcus exiguus]NBC41937.1 hypothetical protein [Corallococcus exiguus]TNV65337.1 hypothetical protein FH620_10095 [Corallococcus exiguus]